MAFLLLPTLLGRPQDQKQHDYLYWELTAGHGFQEIRMGDWKADILNVSQPGTAQAGTLQSSR